MARGDDAIGHDVRQGPELPTSDHDGPQTSLDILDNGVFIIPTKEAYQCDVDRAFTDEIDSLILEIPTTAKTNGKNQNQGRRSIQSLACDNSPL